MMLMADDTLNFWDFNSVGVGGSGGDGDDIESGGEFTNNDDDVNLCMDLDSFFSILGENPDPQESSPEDSSFQNVSQADSAYNVGNREMTGHQGFEEAPPLGTYLPGPHASFLSYDLEASNFRNWGSDSLFESDGNFDNGKLELSAQIGSPFKMLHPEPQDETPNCDTAYNFAALDVNHVPDCPEKADLSHVRGHVDSKYTSYSPVVENSNINSGNYGIPSENSMETLGAPDNNSCISMEISSHNATGTELNIGQVYENRCSDTPATQYCTSMDDTALADSTSQYLSDSFSLQFMPSNEEMIYVKDEKEFPTESARFNSKMISTAQFGRLGNYAPQMSAIDLYDVEGFNENYISPFSGNSFTNVSDDVKGSVEPSTQSQSYTTSQGQESCVKDEGSKELVKSKSSIEVVDEAVTRKFFPCSNNSFFPGKKLKGSYSEVYDKTADRYPVDGGCSVLQAAKQFPSCVQQSTSTMKPLGHIKVEKEGKLIQHKSMGYNLSKISIESIQRRSLDRKNHVDDDSDICILEDISVPPRSNVSLTHGKSLVTSQRSTISDPLYHTGVGGNMKLKANDERFVYRVALQDLSQPKSESNPPDGVLAVPLLRHQKIALSWMVQKETGSLFCSGGILADDQGLGKTISTIALILKERSPSSTTFQKNLEQGELEMLNLEDDDVLELDGTNSRNASVQARGRPAAGTLVVCPTSVLRQWAEELHNKVTGKANLSVLVYHGSNRTKDPCELAKYDVVLTTYSIVSMEVPKQPLVDKDDEEKSKPKAMSSMELASSRKRKYPSSDKKGLKAKKAMDRALLESAARPLARVNWFRVVLDEAQSIKNFRTQVARACWGLRAKRRWCLSGTPIQNAVDDLYSYFRFLKYDPYAVYQSFCSTIKAPINRNPADGYRKLQAVLKTIMLRRTKGTLLDGEPIVNLPPKSVELRRVDFSDEERDFYSRLEADSRAQFEVYAAAGTVKQNYVNILLMLLRLRQACDHPLLVNRNISTSIWKSSVEMAKKLPWDKRTRLLSCLEASLAICGICNDPPEDAVVTICGHVFCNQCICEHLTGDDNQCPNTNCKVQLSVSSVFSKDTLKSSLSDQTAQDKSPDSFGSELVEALEPCSDIISCGSSKIKAVLEVLLSLSKPQDCTARNGSLKWLDESTSCSKASINPHSWGVHKDIPDETSIVVDKDLSNPIKVAGEKAIVFSQWTRMLDLLEACLKNSSIQYRRLDGTMSVVARDNAVKDFNTRPEVTVMIMSLKAASLGLNMVAACHVVLLDLWWNPTTEDQAIDRAHRIGQTRPVTVLRLTVKDTVEDRILALQEKKREMVASAFGEDETGSRQTRLTVEDLQYLFRV